MGRADACQNQCRSLVSINGIVTQDDRVQRFREPIGFELERDRIVILKPGVLCRAEGSACVISETVMQILRPD